MVRKRQSKKNNLKQNVEIVLYVTRSLFLNYSYAQARRWAIRWGGQLNRHASVLRRVRMLYVEMTNLLHQERQAYNARYRAISWVDPMVSFNAHTPKDDGYLSFIDHVRQKVIASQNYYIGDGE